MSISKRETKQLLERLIFEDMQPRNWVQDVWEMNPLLGDSAAKLLDVFEALVECCSQEELEKLLQSFERDHFE